jgi:hypothetical protein
MDALKEHFVSRFTNVRIKTQHTVAFFGQVSDLARGDPPAETPGMTEPLSFRQIRLASSKLNLGQLSFGVLGTQFFVGSFKFLNIYAQIIPHQPQ